MIFCADWLSLGDTRPVIDDVVGREEDNIAALFARAADKVKVDADEEEGGPWTPGSTDRYSPVSVLLYLETKPRDGVGAGIRAGAGSDGDASAVTATKGAACCSDSVGQIAGSTATGDVACAAVGAPTVTSMGVSVGWWIDTATATGIMSPRTQGPRTAVEVDIGCTVEVERLAAFDVIRFLKKISPGDC